MELREFMKNENISENDIVEAARIINVLCRDLSACKLCPLYNGSRCIATKTSGVSIVGIVKERMKKLLNPNRMDKVAELLGVKLGQQFIVKSRCDDEFYCYMNKEGLKLAGDKDADCRNLLGDMLTGKAYIIKKEKKDE